MLYFEQINQHYIYKRKINNINLFWFPHIMLVNINREICLIYYDILEDYIFDVSFSTLEKYIGYMLIKFNTKMNRIIIYLISKL
jgi:hypothetical protein